MIFNPDWRRRKSAAFELAANSTARRTLCLDLFGAPASVYANANLSIYSAQACNAACSFCVEELRPASRGRALSTQKTREPDDAVYFANLESTFEALQGLNPTTSITGGEASKDPRLPGIVRTVDRFKMRKRTLTTNASGLLDRREGKRNIDWLCEHRFHHLNISIAHREHQRNARLMRLRDGLSPEQLRLAISLASEAGVRPRLSCVLLREGVGTLDEVVEYLDFAAGLSVDNVIFRQLMLSDPATHADNSVVRYGDSQRVSLGALLNQVSSDERFHFVKQIVGYYYYVEVWRFGTIDVVFEEADLRQLEAVKRSDGGVIHELIFHPNARLCSTWQPWDGVLGPGA